MSTAPQSIALLLGRTGLALMFVFSGLAKLGGYAATQQYMESAGVPGMLLPLVIFAEVGGGLAVIAGLLTRTAASALAVFTLAAGVLFHFDPADQNQMTHLFKNVAIASGFLILAVHGAGRYSLDALFARRASGRGAVQPARVEGSRA
jgi:putative oxidoreductase